MSSERALRAYIEVLRRKLGGASQRVWDARRKSDDILEWANRKVAEFRDQRDELRERVAGLNEVVGEIARQRDALRAILAPLLDEAGDEYATICPFCLFDREMEREPPWITHEPDCPVLRKDELLGRTEEGG